MNRFCVASDLCNCSSGYEFVNDICEPQYDDGCLNGLCAAPNNCHCDKGYKMDKNEKCIKVCDSKCINGKCRWYLQMWWFVHK